MPKPVMTVTSAPRSTQNCLLHTGTQHRSLWSSYLWCCRTDPPVTARMVTTPRCTWQHLDRRPRGANSLLRTSLSGKQSCPQLLTPSVDARARTRRQDLRSEYANGATGCDPSVQNGDPGRSRRRVVPGSLPFPGVRSSSTAAHCTTGVKITAYRILVLNRSLRKAAELEYRMFLRLR
jgi:hypothetical protein